MRLAWIALRDFRCYEKLDFTPEAGVNVLVGDNGAGKTSVLEAIAYLGQLRSFRRTPDVSLIRGGSDEAVVRGGFERSSGEVKVEVSLPREGRRRILMNGKRPVRHSIVHAEIPLVAFLPDDLDLVKRGPGLRREYLDDLGASLSPTTGADLGEYEKSVRQRNALLRQEGRHADPMTLDVWDQRIAELGSRVLSHRLTLLDELGPVLKESYRVVGGDSGVVSWDYVAPWTDKEFRDGSRAPDGNVGVLLEALASRRPRDLELRTTSAGPHRDDPRLFLDGRQIRTQASQGEQRSAALGLRMAAYRLLEARHDQPPLLLLDDVFSELDPGRAAGVMQLLPGGQVFVTTARHDDVPVEGRRWNVSQGTVQ